ncbi:type II secretion system F family protein [Halorussus salilacus]|uniref:type II secretion system F family protein n=1 Tax=Halorussus salilacus TaxID=2953750 RepID=UPI00209CEF13|nr:type II secretion system F family protein [Halorussus salilacus]USZ69221.1 type II secretion system F family protein [Halorussus salilacus]
MNTSANANHGASTLSVLDRALYALFSRHADSSRHDADRKRYRATDVTASFDVYLARTYGLSWLAFALVAFWAFAVAVALPDATVAAATAFVRRGVPGLEAVRTPDLTRTTAAVLTGVAAGFAGKRATVALGGLYLKWTASARESSIERTLPGAVRYLHALSSGSDDGAAMLRKVADRQQAYGETAVAFRKVLNKAILTGSLDEGLRIVARDTPSRDALAPFLVKFREHSEQGPDALAQYLRMEGRMLSHRQSRTREQAGDFLELLAEMFIVLLVMPALLVIVITVMSVLAPGLNEPTPTPFGSVSARAVLVYGSAAFILVVGAGAAALVGALRPADQSGPTYDRPASALATVASALANPASSVVAFAPLAVAVAGLLRSVGYGPVDVVLLGYVSFALPVGLVALRRARIDDAKDREIKDFVHAVSGHVSLGRPFSEAVERVAGNVDLGALNPDVADLAFNANLTTREGDLRASALSRFVDRVGTPLADQTIGLVTGALDAGGDAEAVFETLQVEIGRLYHERKALRANMLVYVAVGWTTALLVVGIMVAVNGYVLDSFAQLSSLSTADAGMALDPDAVQPARDRHRFYVVTQATMLACGWFAGYASRGRYEAMLHSAALVGIAHFVFAGVGMI